MCKLGVYKNTKYAKDGKPNRWFKYRNISICILKFSPSLSLGAINGYRDAKKRLLVRDCDEQDGTGGGCRWVDSGSDNDGNCDCVWEDEDTERGFILRFFMAVVVTSALSVTVWEDEGTELGLFLRFFMGFLVTSGLSVTVWEDEGTELGFVLCFFMAFLVTSGLSVTVFPLAPVPFCDSTFEHAPSINNTFTEQYARYYSASTRDWLATYIWYICIYTYIYV